MFCVKCETMVHWKDDEPPANFGLGDHTALA